MLFEGVGASLIASVVFEGVRAALDRRAIAREFDAALDDAHRAFRRSHPGFPIEIFDKTFLTGAAAPELCKFFTATKRPNPDRLAALANKDFPDMTLVTGEEMAAFVARLDDALQEKKRFRELIDSYHTKHASEGVDEIKQDVQAIRERVEKTPTADPAKVYSKYQLPPAPAGFVDRPEVAQIIDALRDGLAAVNAVDGMGGVGKTAAALQAAHRLVNRGRFPDAQAFIDLQGSPGREPVGADEALSALLRPFLMPQEAPPEKEADLGAMWRERTDGLDMLLFLDNARDEAAISPLLTGHASCTTIVTSRARMALAGIKPVALDVLEPVAAAELARRWANQRDANRISEAQSFDLAKASGYLPLAIEIAGGTLDTQIGRDPSEFIADIADRSKSLDTLKRGERSMRATLAVSMDTLTEEQCARWEALGVFEGGFDEAAASAVWETDEADETLGPLDQRNLVRYDKVSGRYGLHNLVRALALEKLASDAAREYRAHGRHAYHYFSVLLAANNLYTTGRDLEGLALIDMAMSNIRAGQLWAAGFHDESAVKLAASYPNFACLSLRLLPRERIEWLQAAIRAAQLLKNREAEADALGNLAAAYQAQGDLEKATQVIHRSLKLEKELDRKDGMAVDYSTLAIIYRTQGNSAAAEENFLRSLNINKEIGREQGVALQYGNLGNIYADRGDFGRALEMHLKCLALQEQLGSSAGVAIALGNVGIARAALGQVDLAKEEYQRSLAINEEIGRKDGMAHQFGNLGNLFAAQGDVDRAAEMYQRGLALYRELGARRMIEKFEGWLRNLPSGGDH